jgi:hypothetical protein
MAVPPKRDRSLHACSVAWAGQSKEHQIQVWCSRRPVRLWHPLLADLQHLVVAHGDPEHRAALMRQGREPGRLTGTSWLLPAIWLAVMVASAPTERVRSLGFTLRMK